MKQTEPCLHGHLLCATVYGGPCADETFQNKAAEIAQAFQDNLSDWLSPAELRVMRIRNAGESDDWVCHSHDFCDANGAMGDAFNACGESYSEELWSMAWHLSAEFLGR